MRETRQSGSEGGGGDSPDPYPGQCGTDCRCESPADGDGPVKIPCRGVDGDPGWVKLDCHFLCQGDSP
jgi:hypothetical protein